MKPSILLIVISVTFLFSSCKSKEEKEMDLLQTYITENNITTEPTASGLYYIETIKGSGDFAETGDLVRVHYKGSLLDGEIFDSSYDRGEPSEFTLGFLIQGWNEGLTYMKQGGKATLIIPSFLGYGSTGSGDKIPGYSTLIFEIELIGIL